jgi:hypothetical protein
MHDTHHTALLLAGMSCQGQLELNTSQVDVTHLVVLQ